MFSNKWRNQTQAKTLHQQAIALTSIQFCLCIFCKNSILFRQM
ncbi:hypothetical protein HMPREF6745_0294 [Prevotella sp. oral taxon 472 str. F0295]|nr:hypothetical protein HMPREF6745_0294 [Prevotella sp. oral taxon 472 str. F0295]